MEEPEQIQDDLLSAAKPATGASVWEALQIRPGELSRSAQLFLYLFGASVVFTTARTARDALFLSEFPLTWLPWLAVAFGAVAALITPFYSPLANRFRRDRFNSAFAVGLAMSYLTAWVLVNIHWRPVYPILYVWVEVTNNLLIVQFWTFANDLHDAREAKRLFGVIGSGRMLGILVCGIAVSMAVRQIGTASLLIVNACVLVLMSILVLRIGRTYIKSTGVARIVSEGSRPSQSAASVWKSKYILWIIAMIAFTYVVATIGDYQFKAIARANYSGEKLASFFALFYGLTGAAAFIFQFFISSRLLAAFGIAAGLLAMPLMLGLSNLSLLLTGGALLSAAAIKFSDNAFQFTINDSSLQMLYYPFPDSLKTRLKAILEGAVKPVGYGLGGLLLILLAKRLGPVGLAWVAIPMIGLWVSSVVVLRKLYLDALVQSLAQHQFETAGLDLSPSPQIVQVLSETVRTGNEAQAAFALDTLREVDAEAAAGLAAGLLERPERRLSAMERVAGLPVDPEVVRKYLDDADVRVRKAAIRAYISLVHEDGIERITPHLASQDTGESDAACAALIHDGGLDGVLLAADHLRRLLTGTDPERARAARILGEAKVRAFARPLHRLIADPSLVVRRAAAEAAGRVKSRKLLKPLIEMLGDWHLRAITVQALEAYGEKALGTLRDALGDETVPLETRLWIPRLIRRIHHPDAVHALWAHAETPNERLRAQVLHHASRLREQWAITIEPRKVRDYLDTERAAAALWLNRRTTLRPHLPDPLLDEAIESEIRWCRRRVFSLLRVLYPFEAISSIRLSVEGPNPARRATALETLDNMLERHQRDWIVPLLDTGAGERAAVAVRSANTPPAETSGQIHEQVLAGSDAYLAAVMVRILIRTKHFQTASVDPAALVRWGEMALEELCAARLHGRGDAAVFEKIARERGLTRLAQLIENYRTKPEGNTMFTTLERVLFLKGVSLFKEVPGDDLAGIAQESSVAEFKDGQDVFRHGDAGDALFLIVSGKVRIHIGTSDIAQIGAGECFGEMAILDNAPRSATVTALGDLVTLKITQEDFFEILADRPEIARSVFSVLTARLRTADAEIRRLTSPAAA